MRRAKSWRGRRQQYWRKRPNKEEKEVGDSFFDIVKLPPFLKTYMVWRNCSKSISAVVVLKEILSSIHFSLVHVHSKKTTGKYGK